MLPILHHRQRRGTLAFTLAVLLIEHAVPRTVSAWAVPAATPPAAAEPSRDKLAEADRHFRRGVDLYEDGDMAAALVEFARAYDIVPSYKILYDLGQVAYRRQDYVRALNHFQRYLGDGRDIIAPERRRQVEDDVRRLEQRIGRIVVEVNPDDNGAELRLDDVPVGAAPLLDPLLANVGTRKVELIRPDGDRQTQLVDLVGGETAHLRFPRTAVLRLTPTAADLGRGAGGAAAASLTLVNLPNTLPATTDEPARGWSVWAGWTLTGLLAAVATATGVVALNSSRDLQQSRDAYPVAPGVLDRLSRRAHTLALTTDGLLVGAAVAAAVSLYLTVRHAGVAEAPATTDGGSRFSSVRRDQQRRLRP
ncbi:MAG: hypothetical protein ABJA82_01570 [Myxococcales bacterium]